MPVTFTHVVSWVRISFLFKESYFIVYIYHILSSVHHCRPHLLHRWPQKLSSLRKHKSCRPPAVFIAKSSTGFHIQRPTAWVPFHSHYTDALVLEVSMATKHTLTARPGPQSYTYACCQVHFLSLVSTPMQTHGYQSWCKCIPSAPAATAVHTRAENLNPYHWPLPPCTHIHSWPLPLPWP